MIREGDKVIVIKSLDIDGYFEDYDIKIGNIYTVKRIEKGGNFFIDCGKNINFSPEEVSKAIPNNKLSRLIYPNYIPTVCGKYLRRKGNE